MVAERREGVAVELGEVVVVGKGEGIMVRMGEGVVVEGMGEGVVVGRKGVQVSGLSDGTETLVVPLWRAWGGSSSGGSQGRLRRCVERLGVPEVMQLSSTGTSLRGPHIKDAKGDNPAVQC